MNPAPIRPMRISRIARYCRLAISSPTKWGRVGRGHCGRAIALAECLVQLGFKAPSLILPHFVGEEILLQRRSLHRRAEVPRREFVVAVAIFLASRFLARRRVEDHPEDAL